MEAWARGRAVAAGVTIDAYKKKQQPQVAPLDGEDEYLEEEELDPAVGLMLG